jgi:hypothetical protein
MIRYVSNVDQLHDILSHGIDNMKVTWVASVLHYHGDRINWSLVQPYELTDRNNHTRDIVAALTNGGYGKLVSGTVHIGWCERVIYSHKVSQRDGWKAAQILTLLINASSRSGRTVTVSGSGTQVDEKKKPTNESEGGVSSCSLTLMRAASHGTLLYEDIDVLHGQVNGPKSQVIDIRWLMTKYIPRL